MQPSVFLDRTVLVTGASSGIGRALAEAFAAAGARLALTARRQEQLEALADEVAGSGKPRPAVIPADLCEPDASARVYEQAAAALGPIDVLVNNAGLGFVGPFTQARPADTDRMIDLNVRALLHLTHLALPGMLERGRGWILNVGSGAAYLPMPYLAAYSATKALVLSFSEALWAECRRKGVRVTCVNPGTTRTEFFDHHPRTPLRDKLLEGAMPPERVAAIALDALARGRPAVTCGLGNRVGIGLGRLLPRRWIARLLARHLRSIAPRKGP